MDYGALIAVAAFFVAFQMTTRFSVRPLLAASVAVLIPFLVSLVIKVILAIGYNSPILQNLFSFDSVVALLIQFAIAIFVFKKIRDTESFSATVAWGISGFILIAVIVPLLPIGRFF